MTTEFEQKLSRLRLVMAAGNYDCVHLTQLPNLSWLFCGADLGFRARYKLKAEIVITSKKAVLFASDATKKVLAGFSLPTKLDCVYAPLLGYKQLAQELLTGKILTDDSSSEFESKDFWPLRVPLTLEEISRYRDVGQRLSAALLDVLPSVKPGVTRQHVFDALYAALPARGLTPLSIFVFSDDGLENYLDVLDKSKKIKKSFSVDVSVCKHGLLARATRMVSFGYLAQEARQRYTHLLELEKTVLDYTRHGILAAELWREMTEYTKSLPYRNWKYYLYGGAIGYKAPDFEITKDAGTKMLVDGAAYAWSPALPGVRLQDTFLLLNDKLEVLSESQTWPTRVVGGRKRPEVLEL
jgi:Xaa-Pro dipeptidase